MLRIGFHHSTGDVVIIRDADLDPDKYSLVFEPIISVEFDVCHAFRFLYQTSKSPLMYFLYGLCWLISHDSSLGLYS